MIVSRYRKINPIVTGIIMLTMVLIFGCGGKGNPVVPAGNDTNQAEMTTDNTGNLPEQRIMMGYWDVEINTEQLTASIVPDRNAEIHFNILQLLEGWACTDCVTIGNIKWTPQNTLLVDFGVRNPFPPDRLDLTARDTRGIIIFDADPNSYFPNHTTRGKHGDNVPLNASRIIVNPDGYTTHYNRETAFEGLYMDQYRRGRFTPENENAIVGNLHAYKAFYSHEQGRMLYPGATDIQTYELNVQKWTIFRFGYSVDACWQMPLTWPVTDPYTDFPISANSNEAYQISMSILDNNIDRHGGSADLLVDIYDHQGFDTISTISLEAPDFFQGKIDIDPNMYLWDNYPITRYQIAIHNTYGHGDVENGGSDVLIDVEDTVMSVVGDDLQAFNIWTIPVTDIASGWRPRDGTFLNQEFFGPHPNGKDLDFTVISQPADEWAFEPGESMLLFKDESREKYVAYNRDFTDYKNFAGYPGSPGSWIEATRSIDAAAGGAFGVQSDSDMTVSGSYKVKNCTSMHLPGGAFTTCWYTGSLSDPAPYLEIGGDVSGGFGNTLGDPIYAYYKFDPSAGYPMPPLTSIQRIGEPYNDPNNAFRAMIPTQVLMTEGTLPLQYGVCSEYFVAMGIDDRIPGEPNQFTVDVYTVENNPVTLTDNRREMDVYRIDFTSPLAYQRIRTYTNSMLGTSSIPWSAGVSPQIIDVDVLPAFTNNVYMGNGNYPEHNWVAVLFAQSPGKWFIEIFDVYDETGVSGDNWKKPIYYMGPYSGMGIAMDVDPKNFEIYVLSDDLPLGTGQYRLSCLEYY
ncbi:MAG: hypothetical protein NTY09_05450 [bacterium]|nr:hypothetical protein [bacterium]